MKWKPDVTIQRGSEYIFQYEDESQTVNKEYHYIIDAIELGITDDKKLLNIVMEMEHADEVVAGFCLAQFIVDYGRYISNDVGHVVIEA